MKLIKSHQLKYDHTSACVVFLFLFKYAAFEAAQKVIFLSSVTTIFFLNEHPCL